MPVYKKRKTLSFSCSLKCGIRVSHNSEMKIWHRHTLKFNIIFTIPYGGDRAELKFFSLYKSSYMCVWETQKEIEKVYMVMSENCYHNFSV